MLFTAVAICHQTRNLKSEKYGIYGWDFMEKVFLELAIGKSRLLDVRQLSDADEEAIAFSLESAFSDDGNAINTTLDRIGERTSLLLELTDFILDEFDGNYSALIQETDGRLINNGHGLYEILEKTKAFDDPLRKKSSFLVKLLIDSGLFNIKDPENYIPIMDYHMQRVLLRLGCVEIQDDDLLFALKSRLPQKTDRPVREACISAVNELSRSSGIPPWQMNDIFWPLGRSCCNETTLCTDKFCTKEPCSFQLIVLVPDHKICSFESVCKGFLHHESKLLWEPFIETHYY
ncbi:MAG: hypothetical protein HGA37_05550 [Lentimicrobium sp.]|nr:hypothetical protein [Lentimicrobium sp.]